MEHVDQGYLALCYHYIRPEKGLDVFPNLLGNDEATFRKHIELLKTHYQIVGIDDALAFSRSERIIEGNQHGVLFTFDDGLSDHYRAASILAEYGIQAVFFAPTCIFADQMPANPTIIHYCLAEYRISGFLKGYRVALDASGLDVDRYNITFDQGDDPWDVIGKIKSKFRYELSYKNARAVLLHIYEHLLLKDYPDALEIMHLTPSQLSEMLAMGHSVGVHSHSHISVAATQLTDEEIITELISPKHYLEQTFQTPIQTLSYPFGEEKDCLPSDALKGHTNAYQLAFTVNKILNTSATPPLELGRYMPMSTDDETKLHQILTHIAKGRDI